MFPDQPGYVDERVRREWHCGWMDPEEWTEPCSLPPYVGFGTCTVELDEVKIGGRRVCPGWLVRQPGVIDGCQAGLAYQKGELSTFFPRPSNVILEAASGFVKSVNEYEAAEMRRRAQQAGR